MPKDKKTTKIVASPADTGILIQYKMWKIYVN